MHLFLREQPLIKRGALIMNRSGTLKLASSSGAGITLNTKRRFIYATTMDKRAV
ncbi:hypothetical protein CPS_0860 [Colwellia psychrerythraea 34H]|uniref:Uncharacterized protein n=1 Tax=Colwellia psychrerythraea (strain 34H / ATCC BAA-681) TaxID=167879 RepID=Q488A6_COLP3|nr:hypothetical protein CPS_0860 [Colwellia psychrerythraea 34H]